MVYSVPANFSSRSIFFETISYDANVNYRQWNKKNPTALAKVMNNNLSIRLILDLQIYLRLVSRERDAMQIRNILADDSTAEALEIIVAPIFAFLRRTYKIGNMSQATTDLQKFLDQLIIIIDALRSRIQDPQKVR